VTPRAAFISQASASDLGTGASRELLTRPSSTPSSSPAPIATMVNWIVVHRPLRNRGP